MRQLLKCVAVIGLTLTALASAQAGGNGGHSYGGNHSSGRSNYGSYSNYHYNPHFNYGYYGTRFLNYNYRCWCSTYGCYQYWCPSSSCWYFYVPTYSCYVPIQYYSSVFPSAPVTTNVQTTVVNEQNSFPPGPVTPAIAPAPAISTPAATNVQTTVVDKQKGSPVIAGTPGPAIP